MWGARGPVMAPREAGQRESLSGGRGWAGFCPQICVHIFGLSNQPPLFRPQGTSGKAQAWASGDWVLNHSFLTAAVVLIEIKILG